MGYFLHHPDGYVNIGGLIVPLAWFLTQEPAYSLPAECLGREYMQEDHPVIDDPSKHVLFTRFSQESGSLPYIDGDTYISKKSTYEIAYQAYLDQQALPQTVADAKTYQINKTLAYRHDKEDDGVIVSGVTYQSAASYYDRWKNEHDYALRNSFLLSGYYVTDINGNEVTMLDVEELTTLVTTIDEFYWSLRKTFDDHAQAINALATIPDILAYDYTTGWVPTPFDTTTTFYASFAIAVVADYAVGSTTLTAVGGASISDGWLDLSFNDNRYVDGSAIANADSQQIGTISFLYKPNYSGAPANDQSIFVITKVELDYVNRIQLVHSSTGPNLFITINDSTGVQIISADLGNWIPVAGTEYNFVFHYDITTGNTWLKIDNVLVGAVDTTTGTRDSNIGLLRIGNTWDTYSPTYSNFKMKNLRISST